MYDAQRGTPARSGIERQGVADGRRFLLVERPGIPWDEATDGWTAADRADYERARRRSPAVVLLDGGTGQATVRAPAVLRESLLSLWREGEDDGVVRRELARLAEDDDVPPRAA